jgi:glycerol transport system substrate-binding protein
MPETRKSHRRRGLVDRRTLLKGAGALGVSAALPATAAEPVAATDRMRMDAARRWTLVEFQPSTLSEDEQMAEMEFFIRASAPFRGQQIFVVSETIATHEYEARYLARAFREITDITVVHDVIAESELVNRMQIQMRTGRNLYDAYVNDSDHLGTHWRYGTAVPITDWIAGDGAAFTLPTLDLSDFIGLSFTTAPTARSTSCRTSSSRISTGSATTGFSDRNCRNSSPTATAIRSAFR